jgi:transcription termination factor Rho
MAEVMYVFALTGGIATGKSTFARLFQELLPKAEVFDCDDCVGRLLAEPAIIELVITVLGAEVGDGKGGLSRNRLRDHVFDDAEARAALEGVLHPRVREECLEFKERTAKEGVSPVFIADVPLLFESGFDFGYERSLLVATTRETQLARLKSRDGFDDKMADAILAAQLPIEEKIPLADVVFWNEGSEDLLRRQIRRFLQTLNLMSDRDTPAPEGSEETTPKSSDAPAEAAAVMEPPKPEIPERLEVEQLRSRSLSDLLDLAGTLPVRLPAFSSKSQVIFEIISYYASEGCHLEAEGVLEMAKDSFGMLRDPKRSFKQSPDDFYMGSNLIRDLELRPGQLVRCTLRPPRDRDKFLSAGAVLTVEGIPVEEYKAAKPFEELTSQFPDERFILECKEKDDMAVRLVDLVAPLGKGSRGLIVAPPRGGKTILLKQIARSIQSSNPGTALIVLLLDERPEEVTDFEETVDAQVYSSTFDEPSKRHAAVADTVLERARRLVELGQDVVILLDSLTRLARGYNNAQRGGPIGSGGLSPAALAESRKFFGAARNVEEGGSLTILATCLVETESRMDDVIFEELKGTGNMEIRLDRDLAERRIYPAIHIPQSGTRNDDRLYHADEMPKVIDLRRQLTGLPVGEAVGTLMNQLAKTSSNAEFLLRGLK